MAKLKSAQFPTINPDDISLIFPDDKPYAWRRENDITIDLNDKDNPFARFYDERVLLPVPAEAVRNTMAVGIVDAVVLFEFQGKLLVDAGNQRIKRRRLANAIAIEQGLETGNVPYQAKKTDDYSQLSLIAISTNRFRQDSDYATTAREARRMMERNNWTKDETAEAYGVSRTAINQWFDFLDMAPEVLKAVEKKKTTPTTVLNWRKLPHEEQVELLNTELAVLESPTVSSNGAKAAPPKKLTGTVAKKAVAEKTGVSFTTDLSPEKLYAKAFAAVLKLEPSERLRLFSVFDETGDEVAIITAEDMAVIEGHDDAVIFTEATPELEVEYDDAVKHVEPDGVQVVRRKRAAK